MKTILVATDFSERSDRALRRATLLAKNDEARLVLVHGIDDEQPERLADSARREAETLIGELAHSVTTFDGVACEGVVVSGPLDEVVATAAEDFDADLLVVGAHRQRPFHDIFLGTTVDRILRRSLRPVLMAKSTPAGPHHRILFATDMSQGCTNAIRTARDLGLLADARLSVVHVFAAPGQELMLHASASTKEVLAYVESERSKAASRLSAYLGDIGLEADARLAELAEVSTAGTIDDCARDMKADLIVIGTQARSTIARFVLGSVAQGVLRSTASDVLVVPPPDAD
ncbi:universal stress protein [Chelativorans sp. ZYF759]|uniref:universal stress protein n=1 Tax=Chelativorans sp. ZYF759 TaxID=2692213 RepID=UPI00145E82C8|nr:universal stress protein [Chelativorans sp. ZYF759]NMG40646.1 universal stress protein [Chelativorans sp. ZYF759]